MSQQKKYQQLRKPENLKAAKNIYEFLKKNKTMSQKTFDDIYMRANDITYKHGSFDHLIQTTKQFLFDHDLATREEINGLIIWVATQKCFRTKSFENATIEYQYVTNLDIDKAIAYQTINNGYIPAKFEGKVIAKLLTLEGSVANEFISLYEFLKEYNRNRPYVGFIGDKFAITSAIRGMTNIKKI